MPPAPRCRADRLVAPACPTVCSKREQSNAQKLHHQCGTERTKRHRFGDFLYGPALLVSVVAGVGAGFVGSLARPGGNATGFMQFEYSLSGKWLELLKQIAPGLTRTAVLRDAALTAGVGQFAVIQAVAPSVGVDVSAINLRDAGEIERAVAAFARSANGGDLDGGRVVGPPSRADHRAGGLAQAARGLLPTLLRHQRGPDLLWC